MIQILLNVKDDSLVKVIGHTLEPDEDYTDTVMSKIVTVSGVLSYTLVEPQPNQLFKIVEVKE
jgi:hypothetical protein